MLLEDFTLQDLQADIDNAVTQKEKSGGQQHRDRKGRKVVAPALFLWHKVARYKIEHYKKSRPG